MKNTNRPVNLDLTTIQFPATAIVSILHRVSGVILFIGVGLLIPLLYCSLESQEGFYKVQNLLATHAGKFVIWGILTALAFHIVAGLRHLIMDLGFWEEMDSGTCSANMSFLVTLGLSIAAGVWLWL